MKSWINSVKGLCTYKNFKKTVTFTVASLFLILFVLYSILPYIFNHQGRTVMEFLERDTILDDSFPHRFLRKLGEWCVQD